MIGRIDAPFQHPTAQSAGIGLADCGGVHVGRDNRAICRHRLGGFGRRERRRLIWRGIAGGRRHGRVIPGRRHLGFGPGRGIDNPGHGVFDGPGAGLGCGACCPRRIFGGVHRVAGRAFRRSGSVFSGLTGIGNRQRRLLRIGRRGGGILRKGRQGQGCDCNT